MQHVNNIECAECTISLPTSPLVTDEAKAAELLREIGQMIRTSVPQAFEWFLLIVTTD